MPTIVNQFSQADARHPGVNNNLIQEGPIVLDIPDAMADDDITLWTKPAGKHDNMLPPQSVAVFRHTGGDLSTTTGAAATYAVTDGDTYLLNVDVKGNGKLIAVTHVVAGVSAGAATAVQIAASINNDAQLVDGIPLNKIIRAVAGLVANLVTVFATRPRSSVTFTGGTAMVGHAFGGISNTASRVYVNQAIVIAGGTGWTYTYNALTRVFTLKNETGGAVNRVTALVTW